MIIKFLGAHNAESKDTRLASFLVDGVLAVDAGSFVTELSFPEQEKIRAILLSHGHYDHIKGIPAFAFSNAQRTTKIFATPEALEILNSHLVDGVIYPKFTEINSFLKKPALELCPLQFFKPEDIEGYQVLAAPVNHSAGAVGFEIMAPDGTEIFYTGDTGSGLVALWERISPRLLIIDVTFPNRFENVAKDSRHLCPKMLKQELIDLRRIKGYIPRVILIHLSPQHEEGIRKEIRKVSEELGISIEIANEGDRIAI